MEPNPIEPLLKEQSNDCLFSMILAESQTRHCTHRGQYRERGFALVVTLSLMILLTLLAVGLLSLSSISLRSASQSNAVSEARANARLALMLAIGQLQKELGPDQRISASASILTDAQSSGSGDTNETWLGCWNSWAGDNRYISTEHKKADLVPDLSEHRQDSFRSWLVSPSKSVDLETFDAAHDGLSENAIVLLGEGTLDKQALASKMVRVPKLFVESGDSAKPRKGALAWWIGDESQKGTVRAGRKKEDLDEPSAVLAELDSPSSIAAELYTGFDEPPDEDELTRASISRKTLELLPNTTDLGNLYHDLTTSARSVLADVREGGLKRDLNLLAERYDSNMDAPNGLPVSEEFMMYDFGDSHSVPLHDLLTYYSLYKVSPAGTGSKGALVSGSQKPYVYTIGQSEWNAAKDAMTTNLYRMPVLVKTQLLISICAKRENLGNPSRPYRIKIRFTPVLTFWNPYNVPLVINENSGDKIDIELQGIAADLAMWTALKPTWRESSSLGGLTTGKGDDANAVRELVKMRLEESVRFEPGEVRVFSMDRVYTDDLTSVARPLKSGYHTLSGLEVDYYYLRKSRGGEAGAGYNSNDVTFKGSDTIKIGFGSQLLPAKLKHSQGVAFEVRPTISGSAAADYKIQALYARRTSDPVADQLLEFNKKLFEQGSLLSGEKDGTIYKTPYSVQNDLDSDVGVAVAAFTYGVSGEHEASDNWSGDQPRFPSRPFLHSLPTAQSPWIQDLTTAALYNLGWSWRIVNGNEVDNEIAENGGGQGFFGGGWSASEGQNHIVQFEIPQRPFHSMAQFANAVLGGWSIARNAPTASTGGLKPHEATTAMGQGGLAPAVSMPIGNSYAHPLIPAAEAFTTRQMRKYEDGKRSESFVDHSYLANYALWDEYFMSSIASQDKGIHKSSSFQGRTALTMAQEFFGPDVTPLPNHRFTPYANISWNELRSELFSGTNPAENAYQTISRHLLLDGGFNVNSTSVEAWKTLFSSLRNKPTVVLPASATNLNFDLEAHENETPVVGLSIATGNSIKADSSLRSNSSAPEQWRGSFTLDDNQIEKLAEAMVEQVRERGPFLSLSDFINRRLTSETDFAKQGALQAAIEKAGLNRAADASRTVDASRPSALIQDNDPIPFPDAAKGSVIRGSTAYIDQADILRGIDSQLVPRGDTFVIRTCGQSLDAAGVVVASAYCEAVVQRVPDYVDATDKPETRAADLSSQANKSFGRKFELVSFRWLSSNEI